MHRYCHSHNIKNTEIHIHEVSVSPKHNGGLKLRPSSLNQKLLDLEGMNVDLIVIFSFVINLDIKITCDAANRWYITFMDKTKNRQHKCLERNLWSAKNTFLRFYDDFREPSNKAKFELRKRQIPILWHQYRYSHSCCIMISLFVMSTNQITPVSNTSQFGALNLMRCETKWNE